MTGEEGTTERLEPGKGRDTPEKCVEPWGGGSMVETKRLSLPPPTSVAARTSRELRSDTSPLSTLGLPPPTRPTPEEPGKGGAFKRL